MSTEKITNLTLQNYIYQANKPYVAKANFQAYEAIQQDTELQVSLKIVKGFQAQLPSYLKKLKDCKSDNVIKIYEVAFDEETLVLVSQRAAYGTLSNALKKCNRLDESDSTFIGKMIMNGHTDLLRNYCLWVGTEQDIQFTQSGLKLSWNNSIVTYKTQCIPRILYKISMRPQEKQGKMANKCFLPFPKSKMMLQLITISMQSATEISFSNYMKKKQKLAKKVGKNWMALKQYINKNQYFDQVVYLGISKEYGFIRIKIYQKGSVDQKLLQFHKNNPKFVRVRQIYHEQRKTVILSDYSNDGSLYSYVAKLKTANVQLTEEQIEYIYFSLMQPLKYIQQTQIKSLNMLHIKNIYLQNGILKIGEPVPFTDELQITLYERAEVPDFYHPHFKKQPRSHSQKYDTYSLGVLLYKLMYTQYPIFPNGRLHIPSLPNYKTQLKETLIQILGIGGKLKEVEKNIEVSNKVANQVREDEKQIGAIKLMKSQTKLENDAQHKKKNDKSKIIISKEDQTEADLQLQDDDFNCACLECLFTRVSKVVNLDAEQKPTRRWQFVLLLQQRSLKMPRILIKTILAVVMYVMLFYFTFLKTELSYFSDESLLTAHNATTNSGYYTIITTNTTQFDEVFNKTSKTLADVQTMGCLISNHNSNPDYSEVLSYGSQWRGYMVGAFISFLCIVIVKIWQLFSYDIVRAIYDKQMYPSKFYISSWLIFNLSFCSLIFAHYYLFNFLFNSFLLPCAGSWSYFASTQAFLNNSAQFGKVYIVVGSLQLSAIIILALVIGMSHDIKYNRICNPIVMCAPLLIAQYLCCRIGVVNGYYYPNAIQDAAHNYIIRSFLSNGQYVNIFGIIPQLLLLIELGIGVIVDLIFWACLKRRRRMLLAETSAHRMPQLQVS